MAWHVIWHELPYLVRAAGTTVLVSLMGVVFGQAIGIPVCIARLSRRPWLSRAAAAYISFFRGVPMLVQLLLLFYFLPAIGLDVPALVAAVSALSLASAAYIAEIYRGALIAIPPGQVEAAVALGYPGHAVWTTILLPQAVRLALPSLLNELIMLVKASSLVSVVGVTELTHISQDLAATTYRPLEMYVAAGCLYLAMNLGIAGAGHLAERRLARA